MAHIIIIGASTGGLPSAYEIRALLDDSHHVTYKEWWFLSPVESPEACRLMFFQQGLGEYNEHTRDHPAACAPDHEEVP